VLVDPAASEQIRLQASGSIGGELGVAGSVDGLDKSWRRTIRAVDGLDVGP
jgi:hypothetical protein